MCRSSSPKTLVNGKIIDKFCYQDPGDGAVKAHKSEVPFYQGQRPIVLWAKWTHRPHQPGRLPGGRAAIEALQKVFGGNTPEAVIEAVERSGLGGRGGGALHRAQMAPLPCRPPGTSNIGSATPTKGDPGAYMDRAFMEGNPHAVLEGMIIGAYRDRRQPGLHLRAPRIPPRR